MRLPVLTDRQSTNTCLSAVSCLAGNVLQSSLAVDVDSGDTRGWLAAGGQVTAAAANDNDDDDDDEGERLSTDEAGFTAG